MNKPMLAVDCGGLDALTFPLIASPKLDGVRATIADHGHLLSRTLKPIPNVRVQALLSGLPEGLDGELIVGDPTAPDAYRKTVSVVMSDDKPVDGLVFHVFDWQLRGPFWTERLVRLRALFNQLTNRKAITLVPQIYIPSLAELLTIEAEWVAKGYEGVILRAPDAPYKYGRSTLKEGYLLKLKRFVDGEAVVIGVTELMHNANEATTNELGRTARSHKKAGLVPSGVMGTLVVRDTKTGVQFEIGTGFDAQLRAALFPSILVVIGQPDDKRNIYERRVTELAKYKHFPVGAKDKPRHPVFLGWRDKRDV